MKQGATTINDKAEIPVVTVTSATDDAEAQEKEFTFADETEINNLQSEIETSWTKQAEKIAPQLFRLAQLLYSPGRSGAGFRNYLSKINLPKSTAYRWIRDHAKKIGEAPPYPKKTKTSSHLGHTSSPAQFVKLQKQITTYLDGMAEHREEAAKALVEWIQQHFKSSDIAEEAHKKHVDSHAA